MGEVGGLGGEEMSYSHSDIIDSCEEGGYSVESKGGAVRKVGLS